MAAIDQLIQISEKLKNKTDVSPVTVRTFLSWFGAQRRSFWNVVAIRRALADAGVGTVPDFESAYIDSNINFMLVPPETTDVGGGEVPSSSTPVSDAVEAREPIVTVDPTYRISKLEAANKLPICISPDASLESAVTLMMTNDFSQLPVTTGKRDIKGIISWNAIGSRLVIGRNITHVRDAMDVHQEIRLDASIFQSIPIIVQHSYV